LKPDVSGLPVKTNSHLSGIISNDNGALITFRADVQIGVSAVEAEDIPAICVSDYDVAIMAFCANAKSRITTVDPEDIPAICVSDYDVAFMAFCANVKSRFITIDPEDIPATYVSDYDVALMAFRANVKSCIITVKPDSDFASTILYLYCSRKWLTHLVCLQVSSIANPKAVARLFHRLTSRPDIVVERCNTRTCAQSVTP
jgi:hypothetical protein